MLMKGAMRSSTSASNRRKLNFSLKSANAQTFLKFGTPSSRSKSQTQLLFRNDGPHKAITKM